MDGGKMRALIFSGGTIEEDFALSYFKTYKPDYVVAADRGLAFCEKNGIEPDFIVGDFDSFSPERLEEYKSRHSVPVRTFNPVKDATDTEIAIYQALSGGADEIVLLGATGTRLDHCLANMQCLHILADRGIKGCILDRRHRISLHNEPFEVKKSGQHGDYISFFPAGEAVTGLNLEGFKYPLSYYTMENSNSLGVSNEILADTARVSFKSGRLFMIQSRD